MSTIKQWVEDMEKRGSMTPEQLNKAVAEGLGIEVEWQEEAGVYPFTEAEG